MNSHIGLQSHTVVFLEIKHEETYADEIMNNISLSANHSESIYMDWPHSSTHRCWQTETIKAKPRAAGWLRGCTLGSNRATKEGHEEVLLRELQLYFQNLHAFSPDGEGFWGGQTTLDYTKHFSRHLKLRKVETVEPDNGFTSASSSTPWAPLRVSW